MRHAIFCYAVSMLWRVTRQACGLAAFAAIFCSPVTAAEIGTVVETAQAPAPSPHPLARKVQRCTGVTWLTNQTASVLATAYLSAKTRGWVNTRVRTYSINDLIEGRFRSLQINAKRGTYKGVPFGRWAITTQMPFQLKAKKSAESPSGLQAPLMVSIEGNVAQNDLSGALASRLVTDNLRFLKFDLPGLGQQHLQVIDPHVKVDGEKVIVDSRLITVGGAPDTGIELKVIARPVLEKERYIKLYDMEVESPQIRDCAHFGPFAEELFNPLIDFGRYDRFTRAFRLSKLDIKDGRVWYQGRLLLAPKQTAIPTYSAPFSMARLQEREQAEKKP
jgi:hypothetical protein